MLNRFTALFGFFRFIRIFQPELTSLAGGRNKADKSRLKSGPKKAGCIKQSPACVSSAGLLLFLTDFICSRKTLSAFRILH